MFNPTSSQLAWRLPRSLVPLALLLGSLSAAAHSEERLNETLPLSVLSYNVWHEGTQITGGYQAIVNDISALQPDLISLSEVRNYKDDFTHRLASDLQKRGLHYYTYRSGNDVGILSRYPISSWKDLDSFTRANIRINNVDVVLYSGHLDYQNYASVLPRGYDGNSYKQITPVTDTAAVLKMNNASNRPAAVRKMIADASDAVNKGSMVIVTGDFNEPSHQDWTEATRYHFDHNGAIIPWTTTSLLAGAGYSDTWREKYPNPVSHPGFTWVTADKSRNPASVTWTPEADERDRVDYIFYHPNPGITLNRVNIVGLTHSIVSDAAGSRWVEEWDSAAIIPSQGVWPSDHKAVLATFTLHSDEKPQAPEPEKPVAVVNPGFTVTGTTDSSRAYELDGSGSKNAVSWQWSIVSKSGNFWLQERHAGPWVTTVRQAKARALIPANTYGEVTYQLVVTDKAGVRSEPATVTVKVNKPQQPDPDKDFINGLSVMLQPADNGDSVTFSGGVKSVSAAQSTPDYRWTLPPGAIDGSSSQAQQRFTLKKTSSVQYLSVKVTVIAGLASRELEQQIEIPAKESAGSAPRYEAHKVYSVKCTSVTHNGKVWQNQWYVNAGQEEPGRGGSWGAWREANASNNSCR